MLFYVKILCIVKNMEIGISEKYVFNVNLGH